VGGDLADRNEFRAVPAETRTESRHARADSGKLPFDRRAAGLFFWRTHFSRNSDGRGVPCASRAEKQFSSIHVSQARPIPRSSPPGPRWGRGPTFFLADHHGCSNENDRRGNGPVVAPAGKVPAARAGHLHGRNIVRTCHGGPSHKGDYQDRKPRHGFFRWRRGTSSVWVTVLEQLKRADHGRRRPAASSGAAGGSRGEVVITSERGTGRRSPGGRRRDARCGDGSIASDYQNTDQRSFWGWRPPPPPPDH
jgi:hypothetical protein